MALAAVRIANRLQVADEPDQFTLVNEHVACPRQVSFGHDDGRSVAPSSFRAYRDGPGGFSLPLPPNLSSRYIPFG